MDDFDVVRAAAAEAGAGADDVMVALGRIAGARTALDQAEAALITSARGAGLSWRRIAETLGLGSPQAAEQRARRLDTALRGGGRAVTRPWHAEADTPSPGKGPDATSATVNGPLKTAIREHARRTATTTPRRHAPVTGPTIDTIAARRRLTATDFTTDPYYDLTRGSDGTWQVTAADTPIGHLQRDGRRWTPTTIDGTPLATRPSPTRADAAHVIVQHHQAARGGRRRW